MSANPSDARALNVRFGIALRAAMGERQTSAVSLAAAVGVSPTMVRFYRRGKNLPTVAVAEAIAEALDARGIEVLAVQLRIGTCRVCRRPFRRGQTRRVYCGPPCRDAHHKGARTLPMLDPRQAAIDAMCRGCEPEGECRDAVCALRAFSPLPIYRRRSA